MNLATAKWAPHAGYEKEADLKPHRFQHWLTAKPDPDFDAQSTDICAVYKAVADADDTHRTVSIDEKTGRTSVIAARQGRMRTASCLPPS
jgi:hypothetical protein